MQRDELYKWSVEGFLLKCLNKSKSIKVMAKVHKRICKAHRLGLKIIWLIHTYGYYWPTMAVNCISYAKGCVTCQWHSLVQRLLAEELHQTIKP